VNKCKSCNADMVEGAKFCIICGATARKEPQSAVEENRQTTEIARTEKIEVCPICKTSFRKGASFCVSCGTQEKVSAVIPVTGSTKPEGKMQPETEIHQHINKAASEKPEKEIHEEAVMPLKSPQDIQKAKKEADKISGKKGNQDQLKCVDNWVFTTGEEPARQADELDILAYGKGTVSKITFQGSLGSDNLILHGKVKCLGCNKLSIFSLASDRGWGGCNEPATCPCGRKVEIGEYWNDPQNAIFIWASTDTEGVSIEDYPLSITISRVAKV